MILLKILIIYDQDPRPEMMKIKMPNIIDRLTAVWSRSKIIYLYKTVSINGVKTKNDPRRIMTRWLLRNWIILYKKTP